MLTVSYNVAIPEQEALALAQEDLSGAVTVPASLMLWLQYWVPATTLASARPLTAALCLLCILKGDENAEQPSETLAVWSPLLAN